MIIGPEVEFERSEVSLEKYDDGRLSFKPEIMIDGIVFSLQRHYPDRSCVVMVKACPDCYKKSTLEVRSLEDIGRALEAWTKDRWGHTCYPKPPAKICPISREDCNGEMCAWWNVDEEMCVIGLMGVRHGKLSQEAN